MAAQYNWQMDGWPEARCDVPSLGRELAAFAAAAENLRRGKSGHRQVEKLYDPPVMDSMPRNPQIAHVLYLCKAIETWGRGIGVMATECRRVGLPLPITRQEGGYVITTFRRPVAVTSGSNLDQRDPDLIQINPDANNDFSARLLRVIRFNPLISRKVLATELNCSERKVRETIAILRENGVIIRQGADHGGIWRISRKHITSEKPVTHQSEAGSPLHATTQQTTLQTTQNTTQSRGNTTQSERNTTQSKTRKIRLTGLQTMILEWIADHPNTTRKEIAKVVGNVSEDGVKYSLARLQEIGLLRRIGADFNGHWEVVENEEL